MKTFQIERTYITYIDSLVQDCDNSITDALELSHQYSYFHIDGLVQEKHNALELHLSRTNPSIHSYILEKKKDHVITRLDCSTLIAMEATWCRNRNGHYSAVPL